ncbi:MAG: hypothetical protein IK115_04945 [Lachnospiraceae bacterium]|nr:hypothetical protein [Lachnospiraceae bacterium]
MSIQKKINLLFGIRVCLWIVAFVSTAYWMYYSGKLHREEIFDPYEYATLFRPVFYTCLIISLSAVILSFVLYALGRKLKRELKFGQQTAG